ncbi:zinc-dependent alcohol dehydrogenase family protein [Celeribacter indicus]|uniref:Putative alcohol dehydrogenase n=1 Tax=Celeribacter indicus TaxID=1208324 RepID=A0A0B5EAA2_9RHOB|nr:zinc-binding dehydrogenase [Celeribacter indicus]AJE49207.1 putative alcohol dehydrogenase [Celeribacter indicus]SDX51617.1 D-arabinose 1-dehydrogenase, Zn-dependent alcohol dehydrogenase family [Celeribacter indicus]
MKAVVFLGEGELEIRDYPDPAPGPDEVIVEIRASGMCGTDLHHLHGPKRSEDQIVIEGHEPCGVVAEIGSAVHPNEARIGDRVMVHHYDGCRTCHECRSGSTQLCTHSKIVYGGLNGDGSHAHYMKVPAHTLVRLPDELSFKAGAAVSCGTGTAFGAIKRVDLTGEDTVAIFGQGPVGLSCTMFAKAFGARVIALDIGEERLGMAKKFGADYVINPLKDDPVEAIRDLTRGGHGADKSIECSANRDARRQALEAVRLNGTACMVGAYGDMQVDVHQIIQLQKSLLGSLTFSKNMQYDCAAFVAERGLDVETLFTHDFRLEEARRAYDLFDERKIGKGVFVFD